MELTNLSNDELLSQLDSILCSGRRLRAQVIAYLIEVEERRLHLDLACSSLFDFCVRRLGMSEGEAFRRITAARLAKRIPGLLGRIERGEIHLSALVLLRDYLDDRNHDELLDAAKGKSKREVQEIIAARFPKPDAPSVIRKLPSSPAVASSAVPQAERKEQPLLLMGTLCSGSSPSPASDAHGQVGASVLPAVLVPVRDDARATNGAGANEAHRVAPASRDGTGGNDAHRLALESPASASSVNAMPADATPNGGAARNSSAPRVEATPRARIEPLSAGRYKVQLTVSAELREKIERATALMRHRNPSGDLAVVMELAMDLLIAELEKQRLGKTSRPLKEAGGDAHDGRTTSPRVTRPGYVSRAVRRLVFERDGERCTFVDEKGRRCPAREFLELDHIVPRALGGTDDADNLRVVCRMHNHRAAERVFGREYVDERIRLRQNKQPTSAGEDVASMHRPPDAEQSGPAVGSGARAPVSRERARAERASHDYQRVPDDVPPMAELVQRETSGRGRASERSTSASQPEAPPASPGAATERAGSDGREPRSGA